MPESNPRILFLGDAGSVHMQRWADDLSDLGHAVCVASFRASAVPAVKYRADVFRGFGLGKAGYLLAPVRWRKLIAEFRPDIVHAHHITSYGFLGSLLGFDPYFITSWGSDALIMPQRSAFHHWFTMRACAKARSVFTLAPHMSDALVALGVPPSKLVMIPFGVDLRQFTPRTRQVRAGFTREEPLIIFSNRNFGPLYDVESVIRAVHELRDRLPPFELRLAGGGPLEKDLRALTAALGMEDCTRFLGRVTPDEMVLKLQEADIFISSAISDGNNVSLGEAMACGAVPIATDIPANRVWLTHGKTGWLYPAGNPRGLAASIMEGLSHCATWHSIACENRRTIEDRGSSQNSLRRTRNIYSESLSAAGRK